MAFWADLLYACDEPWWSQYIGEVKESFKGELWGFDREVAKFGVNIVKGNTNGEGLGRKNLIHTGGNSGYQAVNLVYLFGAKKIYLLGFDMQRTNGKSHWHGNHPSKLSASSDYPKWCLNFKKLAADLADEGVEVLNITRETALTCFQRKTVEEVLC